ncbi:hypothetical protein CEK26_004762 [Fusarium fujikuroi]|nr:hypothetical protein CEK27_004763 [Fusarium fujikuroi]QGI77981.1 hypothetical protein CEK25_004710 [Fusarium fujikuroi]QGI91693.1 hypothetical protein CEK26_004762 [Fusarium fujikuroi]SCN88311.1 uncharacterized protein FFM5_04351 [Fusarium fujikuroi]SCV38814.1 uncharacterized protein FFFS_05980 [Fusarium fujikuroi]
MIRRVEKLPGIPKRTFKAPASAAGGSYWSPTSTKLLALGLTRPTGPRHIFNPIVYDDYETAKESRRDNLHLYLESGLYGDMQRVNAIYHSSNRPVFQTFLKQTVFNFLFNKRAINIQKYFDAKKLPGLFSYPYSTDQSWDNRGQMGDKARTVKGHQFVPQCKHRNDLNHVPAVVQCVAQDALWPEERSVKIYSRTFPGYFIIGLGRTMLLVVPLTQKFRTEYTVAWRRLTKDGLLKVVLFD